MELIRTGCPPIDDVYSDMLEHIDSGAYCSAVCGLGDYKIPLPPPPKPIGGTAAAAWVGSMDLHGPEISRICSSSEISRFWCKGTRIRSKFSRICLFRGSPVLRFALLTVLGPRRAAPLTCRSKGGFTTAT